MITFIEGRLEEKHPTQAIILAGGIGYEVLIPLSSYDKLPAEGGTVRLLTHYHIREDAHLLYGFASEGERELFRLLLSISGIGPKIALGALSGLSSREIKAAIFTGDAKRLASISGIGKKTAERMVLELRDKINASDGLEAASGVAPGSAEEKLLRDATMALIALGYKQDVAQKMILGVKPRNDLGVEDLVRKALAS